MATTPDEWDEWADAFDAIAASDNLTELRAALPALLALPRLCGHTGPLVPDCGGCEEAETPYRVREIMLAIPAPARPRMVRNGYAWGADRRVPWFYLRALDLDDAGGRPPKNAADAGGTNGHFGHAPASTPYMTCENDPNRDSFGGSVRPPSARPPAPATEAEAVSIMQNVVRMVRAAGGALDLTVTEWGLRCGIEGHTLSRLLTSEAASWGLTVRRHKAGHEGQRWIQLRRTR